MSVRSRAPAVLFLASCALATVFFARAPTAQARGERALTVRIGRTGRLIPSSFLGLSMEINEFRRYADEGPVLQHVLSLIRSGDDPINLRLGGRSADETLWEAPRPLPPWIFDIGRRWLARLNRVTERDRLRVTLNLNLWARSPRMAADFVHAALQALGPSRLAGVAIGNEPDLYRSPLLLPREQLIDKLAGGRPTRLSDYSPTSYRRDYLTYARALSRVAQNLPLLGPEMTRPDLKWFKPLASLHRFRPQFLTVHRYPLSNCWPKTSFEYPRLSSILSDRATDGFAAGLRGAVRLAQQAGRRLWVSEINSASCGGRAGVTNAFASALWAPDALLALVNAGVAGINWHLRPGKLNSPFRLRGLTIQPMPELYGLALFARLAVPGARLAMVRSSPALPNTFRVWAVRSPGGLSVLLINKGARTRSVDILGRGDQTQAVVERLTAPSIRATSGIRLGGQWIGRDSRWHGSLIAQSVPLQAGGHDLTLAPYSAALLRVASSAGSGSTSQ